MKEFYVLSQCQLDADEKVLRVTGEKRRRIPISEVQGIHLMAGYTLTSGVIDLAAKHNVTIHAYNYYGVYRGTFFPPPVEPTGSILYGQVRSRTNENSRLDIARCILDTANEAANDLLRSFNLENNQNLEGDSVENLMLSEARIRKEYYALLDTVLPPYWSILRRGRKPPRRPADAVLGFSNGILYAKTAGWIHRAGLDPRISYVHGQMRAKNPLALDLAEILKPTLSESVLLEVAASGKERSLVTKVGEGVYLNEKGRKFVITVIEDILHRNVKPRGSRRGDKVEIWGQSIPRKLHHSLVVKDAPDFPVIPCTLSSSTMQTLKSGRTSVPD